MNDEWADYLIDALQRDPKFRRAYKQAGRRIKSMGYLGESVAVKPAFRGRRHAW